MSTLVDRLDGPSVLSSSDTIQNHTTGPLAEEGPLYHDGAAWVFNLREEDSDFPFDKRNKQVSPLTDHPDRSTVPLSLDTIQNLKTGPSVEEDEPHNDSGGWSFDMRDADADFPH